MLLLIMQIKEIILYTNLLQELKKFYAEVLELQIINDTDKSFSIVAGFTTLNFNFLKRQQILFITLHLTYRKIYLQKRRNGSHTKFP